MSADPTAPPAPERGRARRRYAVGAVLAGSVALVFATVGDGVDAAGGRGARGMVLDHAHTVTWLLLADALGLAAVLGRWRPASQALAVVAGGCYLVFLAAVLLQP